MLNLTDKKIISLVGIMGSGKTTAGAKLAGNLGYYFIDLDSEIEDHCAMSIAEIFEKKGEKYFRQIEAELLEEIINRDENMVLSLGGGAFIDEKNRTLIKQKTISIWLDANLETLLQRIMAKNNRPLLQNSDKRKTLSDLIIKRKPIYKEADIHIDTSNLNHDFGVKNIIKKINEFLSEKPEEEVIKLNLADKSYDIVVGSSVISQISARISKLKNYSKIIILSDENVAKLHLLKLENQLSSLKTEIHSIISPAGEKAKSFTNLEKVVEEILAIGVDRGTLLIAFGGGVVGDLCGFVASILLRGVDFIQIPTTLLSAVDSSVGGKTAINSKSGKNLIGSFYQPKLVLCDVDFLESLSTRDFLCGYAEVVKYGFINDKKFFQFLDENLPAIKERDKEILQKIIVKSCQIKAKIVELDEKENGLRATLNFGHTFGHVFEKQTGYSNSLFHGEAVAIGMVMAAKMSANLGLLNKDLAFLVEDHLRKVGLPTSIKKIKKDSWKITDLVSHLYKDKKVENKKLTFILLQDIGKCVIKKDVDEKEFVKIISPDL